MLTSSMLWKCDCVVEEFARLAIVVMRRELTSVESKVHMSRQSRIAVWLGYEEKMEVEESQRGER